MQTQKIRQTIAAAMADDDRTQGLANVLRTGAAMLGTPQPEPAIAQGVTFLRQYIEHVPALIEVTMNAAKQAGVGGEVEPLLEGAARYWFEPHDVFPDHQGLVGLMDDAYVFLSLIQAISTAYRERTGKPMLQLDLTPANLGVRHLIGEPFATQLDLVVAGILQGPSIQAAFNALVSRASSFGTLNTPDPIWGNASVDEIVNVRLGAMGIV